MAEALQVIFTVKPQVSREEQEAWSAAHEQWMAMDLDRRFRLKVELCRTKADQLHYGDTKQGHEFKLDREWPKKRHLYIETAERKNKDVPWVPSGIYASSIAWTFMIGDSATYWVFGRRHLQMMDNEMNGGAPLFFHYENDTSKCFFLPEEVARISANITVDTGLPNDDYMQFHIPPGAK